MHLHCKDQLVKAVQGNNYMKCINALHGKNAELLTLKQVVFMVTTML